MSGAPAAAPPAAAPVTVVNSRRVKPGREAEFEAWLEEIGAAAANFPGLLGRQIIRPQDHEHPEFVSIFSFDTYSHLKAWVESDVRKELLARVRPLCEEDNREQVLTGLERWFTLSAQPGLLPPPRWKMAVVTVAVVFPLGQLLGFAMGPVLAPMPKPVAGLVVTVVMVGLMTYVVMPRVTRLLQRFLYPSVQR